MEISKSDWKLFREKLPEWQEAYMEKLVAKYIRMLQKEGNASDKFWELDEKIKRDRKHPGVILEMNKSDLVYDLAILIRKKVITFKDLDEFSDDLKEQVNWILSR